jgi:Na+/H+ antiporter NhaC
LERLITPVIAAANSIAALIAALASAVLATNVATAEQYFAIVLPGLCSRRLLRNAGSRRIVFPDDRCVRNSHIGAHPLEQLRRLDGNHAWGCDAELAARRGL